MPGHGTDLTIAVQDYLKSIYVLESSGERVTTSALAQRMNVSAPSATAMTKRLDELTPASGGHHNEAQMEMIER